MQRLYLQNLKARQTSYLMGVVDTAALVGAAAKATNLSLLSDSPAASPRPHQQPTSGFVCSTINVNGNHRAPKGSSKTTSTADAEFDYSPVLFNAPAGAAADNLLAKKANKHLLQDYEQRRAAAVDFMALAPTQAELDPSMQALVVSQETLAGGEAINTGRLRRGFPPLKLVVVGLVAGGTGPGA
eukprot:gene2320-2628_t